MYLHSICIIQKKIKVFHEYVRLLMTLLIPLVGVVMTLRLIVLPTTATSLSNKITVLFVRSAHMNGLPGRFSLNLNYFVMVTKMIIIYYRFVLNNNLH